MEAVSKEDAGGAVLGVANGAETTALVSATAQSRIVRLFPEILAEVFWHCVWDSEPDARELRRTLFASITHVCRHWREVALAHPALWSRIAISRPACVREWLIRSKQSLLTVRSPSRHPYKGNEVGSWKLILEQMSRLYSIQLDALRDLMPSSGRMDLPAPFLHQFELVEEYAHHKAGHPDIQDYIPQNAPRLEELSLNLTYVETWTNIQLPSNLKVFRFCSGELSSIDVRVWHDLFSMLETLPVLELLELSFPPKTFPKSGLRVFTLPPTLRLLQLRDRGDNVKSHSRLIGCCALPVSTAIEVSSSLYAHAVRLEGLASSIVAKLIEAQNRGMQPIHTVSLNFRLGCFSLRGWAGDKPRPHSLALTEMPPQLKVSFAMSFNDKNESRHHWKQNVETIGPLAEFCTALPLSNVQTVLLEHEVNSWDVGAAYIARHVLAQTKSATALSLTGWDSGELRELFSARPILTTLELNRVDFTWFRPLTKYLEKLKNKGAGMTRLVMHECYSVCSKDVDFNLIRSGGLVANLEWDGLEKLERPHEDSAGEEDSDY